MTEQPTPRLKTRIERHRLYSRVLVTLPTGVAMTTMRRDITASDIEVENFKRRLMHLPPLKEGGE